MQRKIKLIVTILTLFIIFILAFAKFTIIVYEGPPGKITIVSKKKLSFSPFILKIDHYLQNIPSGVAGVIKITDLVKKEEKLQNLDRKHLIDFFISIIKKKNNLTDKK